MVASFILGVIWAAWHFPLMGTEFPPHIVPVFIVNVLCASVLTAWLFNRTGGSLVPLPAFHAMVNTVGAGFVFSMFRGADLTRLWWIYTLLWVLLAAGLTLASPFMTASPSSPVARGSSPKLAAPTEC